MKSAPRSNGCLARQLLYRTKLIIKPKGRTELRIDKVICRCYFAPMIDHGENYDNFQINVNNIRMMIPTENYENVDIDNDNYDLGRD